MKLDLEKLSLESRNALRAAALMGERFSIPVLLQSGFEPATLDPLFDSGVLVEDKGSQARFSDPKLVQEEQDRTPWSIKRQLSHRIAEALEASRAAPELIAQHYGNAQDFVNASKSYARAADKAILVNDYQSALSWLKQAIELWPATEDQASRKRLLKEMGRCARNLGNAGACRMAWEELLEMAIGEEDLEGRIQANQRLAELSNDKPDRVEARQRLEEVARLSSLTRDGFQECKAWFAYGRFLLDNIRVSDAIQADETALEASRRIGQSALESEILAHSALAWAMKGDTEKALERIEESLTIAISKELPEQIAIAYRRKANVMEYSGDYIGYRDLELESLDRCRMEGWDELTHSCLSCVSFAFFRLGQWKQSSEAIGQVRETEGVDGELLAVATSVKACMALLKGQRKQGNSAEEEASRLIQQHGGMVVEFYLYWARGALEMLDGDMDKAGQAFGKLRDFWSLTEDRKDGVSGFLTAASYYADTHNSQSLSECIDILAAIASENSTKESNAAREGALAEKYWHEGKVDLATESLQRSIKAYESLGLQVEKALLWRRKGLIHASAGEDRLADEAWEKSGSVARKLGLRPLLNALGRDRAIVGRTSGDGPGDLAGLTPRQLDVLRLIGQGMTNKEAANQLSLSPRTVEMHVASILERLDCRARTEAINKATRSGLI